MHHQQAAGILVKSVYGSSRSTKYINVEKKIVPVTRNINNMLNSVIDAFRVFPKILNSTYWIKLQIQQTCNPLEYRASLKTLAILSTLKNRP
jgi:ABC-type polysaccharide/polyol phosphate export permease